ncbi:MAG: mechanosensitive ion channel protein MscS [Elusimicrobia bacterium HGW-Elusimicrobia-1]|jgi:small-conductance mechanosensitive channel|nr:MAG: mechanosensitive ion channel protein MscS [Elusimicrobia bacterium HGW-Elusimicrobia-1]
MPLIFVSGGIVAGLVFEKIVLLWLKKVTSRTEWEGDDIIVGALKGMTFLWFALLGVWLAAASAPVSAEIEGHLRRLVAVGYILSVTFVAMRAAVGFVKLYAAKAAGVLPPSSIFINLTRTVVFGIGVLVILQTLGISITPLLTALGVGGLAVALALQDTLSNFFSGLQILLSRQIKPGDYIKLETGEEGYVVDITWRNTTIRALPNNVVVIPNAKIASSLVTNYYMPDKEIAVLMQVGVGYESDLEKVERVTIEAAREVMKTVTGGVETFEPFIRYHTFGDFAIGFSVIMRGKEFTDQFLVKHEFVKKLHARYKSEGINIPFPIRTLEMRNTGDGAAPVVVSVAAGKNK